MLSNRLTISCNLDNLQNIRAFVSSYPFVKEMDEVELNQIILAIDEICANLIIHSNKCDERKKLELRIAEENKAIKFELLDNGVPFDTTNYAEPDLEQYIRRGKKGGLGIMIVKKVMDNVEFSREHNTNVCRMYKILKP